MSRNIKFTISPEFDGAKVNHYLRGRAKLSCRLVNSLKRVPDGIMLNGAHTRTIDIIHTGDILEVNIPEDETQVEPIHFPLDIVYEDEDLLVISKPPFLAMHPTHNHQGDTLANAVAAYFHEQGKQVTFRCIGRLDRDTSGLVVCALNKYSAARLSGNINKEYMAIATGVYEGSGTIDKPIIRPHPNHTYRAVGEGGLPSVTHWTAVESRNNMTLLRINLETGRTHQIRVHFASMGTPLAGDDMYGDNHSLINRHSLHCAKVKFIHPVTGEEVSFTAPLPEDMRKAWEACNPCAQNDNCKMVIHKNNEYT